MKIIERLEIEIEVLQEVLQNLDSFGTENIEVIVKKTLQKNITILKSKQEQPCPFEDCPGELEIQFTNEKFGVLEVCRTCMSFWDSDGDRHELVE